MGASAVLLCFAAGPLYWVYVNYWDTFTNRQLPPWWFWGLPIAYIIGPGIIGGLVGYGWKQDWPGVRFFSGRNRAPRAWDRLFQDQPAGTVRCKLKSGTWLAGVYAEENGGIPYASGYPEPQDLYLPAMIDIDSVTGDAITDEEDIPIVLDRGVLLRWEEVEFLEFERLPKGTNG